MNIQCKDCNKSLNDCTCIEDTIDMKETLSDKLEKIVSKEPSKFWSESDERVRLREVLTNLSLVNPHHLKMTSDGYGEFPDGYKLTDKGIQYIIEQIKKK
jgi:hypothetical protein